MKAGGVYEQDGEDETCEQRPMKKSNTLPIWGNEKSMNLNPLILTNIQSSQYFKVNLYQLKTYHEVIDEIYYQVNHLEPWEKGSRKTSGQTGMCGGVRGVGAGGIVSTAFCTLYKLYTLRLTRKQVLGLINHSDSPYIRGLGLMYVRFTQPPADLWDWLEPYLNDEEEVDVRAGGGQTSTIGVLARHMLTKLEWHATLFPRIPVPIQKDIEKKLNERNAANAADCREQRDNNTRDNNRDTGRRDETNGEYRGQVEMSRDRERERADNNRERERGDNNRERERGDNNRERERGDNNRERERGDNNRERERGDDNREKGERERERGDDNREKGERERERERERVREKDREREKHQDKHRDRGNHKEKSDRNRSSRHHESSRHPRANSFSRELERERDRHKRDRRSRSRSRDRSRRHRDHH